MRFDLLVIPICSGLRWRPEDMDALGTSIGTIFRNASSGEIDLDVRLDPEFYAVPLEEVTKGDLAAVVRERLDNSPGVTPRLGLVIASRWFHRRDIYGIMFDADLPYPNEAGIGLDDRNGIAREAAAVFVEALHDAGFVGPRFVARTLVHELGHVFNLPHDASQRSFMAETRPGLPESAFEVFKLGHEMFLTECKSPHVHPGGRPWNDRGDLGHLVGL